MCVPDRQVTHTVQNVSCKTVCFTLYFDSSYTYDVSRQYDHMAANVNIIISGTNSNYIICNEFPVIR
jgi:hypothetical protein